MNCDNCGAPMQLVHGQNHLQCGYCQSFSYPHASEPSVDGVQLTETESELDCPVCPDSGLRIGLVDKTQVCVCPECHGFVIDSESLGILIRKLRDEYTGADQTPIPVDPTELEANRNCPACRHRMHSHPYYGPGNSVIDSCSECKLTWMDNGELTRIVRAPGRRGSAPVSQESQRLRDAFYAEGESRRHQTGLF